MVKALLCMALVLGMARPATSYSGSRGMLHSIFPVRSSCPGPVLPLAVSLLARSSARRSELSCALPTQVQQAGGLWQEEQDAGSRRAFLAGSSLAAGTMLAGGARVGPCFAADDSELPLDDNEEQVAWAVDGLEVPTSAGQKAWMWRDLAEGNIVKAATKLAAEDIFYPEWMYGLWEVTSTTRCVEAPLGEELFGRRGSLSEAQNEVGQPLAYQARFRKGRGGRVIADRAFNVDSISRAAMGDSAVLECFLEDGNADRLKMTLVPSGAGGRVFDAFLYVTSRDQTEASVQAARFGCSETSHQTVVAQNDPVRGNVGSQKVLIPRKDSQSVKDIQVIQVFDRGDDEEEAGDTQSFTSVQRISTFMTETEFREKLRAKAFKGPGTEKKFAEIKRTPVDVRVYDITYKLVRRPRARGASPRNAERPS